MDFHPGQVLLTKLGPRIIDWETACQGNPLADMARTSILLRVGQIPRSMGISEQRFHRMRESFCAQYRARYFAINAGASVREINAWESVVAAARLAESIDGEEPELKSIIERKLNSNR